MVDLAVHQHDGGNTGITRALFQLQQREALQLGANIGRGVEQDPVGAVEAGGDGGLGAGLSVQCAVAQPLAVGAVAVPLRKAAPGGGAQYLYFHYCVSAGVKKDQQAKAAPKGRRVLSGWRSTW